MSYLVFFLGLKGRNRALLIALGLVWRALHTTAQPDALLLCPDTALIPRLVHESDSLAETGKFSAALEASRRIYAVCAACYGPAHLKTLRAKMKMGMQLDDLYQKDSAIELYYQCLPAFEAMGNPNLISWCHYQLSLSYRGLGQFSEAHRQIEQAIELIRPDSAAKAVRLAGYRIGEAMVFSAEKNYSAAVARCKSALAVYEANKQLFNQAMAAYNLAEAYFGLQDFQRALEWYLTAYRLLQNERRLGSTYLSDLLVSIGSFYLKTGEPDLGLPYMLEAQTVCLESSGPDSMQYARFLHEFGSFYLESGQFETAVRLLEHSLAIKQQARPGPRERVFQIKTYELLGDAYAGLHQPDRAGAAYCRLLEIARQHLSAHFRDLYQFQCFTKLAEIQYLSGDLPGSLAFCDSAFTYCHFPAKPAEQIFPRDYFRELCRVYAQALVARFKRSFELEALDRAEYFFSLAAQILFREAAELSTKSSKEIKFDRDHLVLEQWLDARMLRFAATGSRADAEAAFHIAGQSKALLLYEARIQKWAAHSAGTPDSLLRAEWDRQGARIAGLELELDSIRNAGVHLTDIALLPLGDTLVRLRNRADSLLLRLRQSCPEYFKIRYQPDTISIVSWQHWLQPDQCMLLYSLSDTVVYAFVLRHDTFCVRAMPLDYALRDSLALYRESITRYFIAAEPTDTLYNQTLERYSVLAAFLYRRLVGPVAALLSSRVILIPEGLLCYLPFETLLTELPAVPGNFTTYPFWLRQAAISYCFSTDLLRAMSDRQSPKPPREWLGIAPFAQPSVAVAHEPGSRRSPGLSPLPFSRREVQSIRDLWGGDVWLGARASQAPFSRQAGLYRIIHLATHGRADEWRGDRSYLAFAGAAGWERMPAGNFFQYTLPADMIVLSACEAGTGALRRGEGLIGLVRAFAWAGAKSILASMWVADDESTSHLMLEFYRLLKAGQPKDLALQQAQLQIGRTWPAKAHPFYWAGFRLYGAVESLR